MSLIVLQGVHKTYQSGKAGEVHALRGVDITLGEGEFAMVMGSSGSGKSTLMNIIGCLDRSSRGNYWLDGEEAGHLDRDARAAIRSRKIGFVFQNFHLLARTSALENVELPLLYQAHPPSYSEMRRRAREALAFVRLENRADHMPSELSGGQQQRVAIARALINRPRLLIADEPTGNLDSRTSLEILRLLQRLNADEGLTILMVTHEPEISAYGKRVVRLFDGRIQSDEPIREPRSAAADRDALGEEEPNDHERDAATLEAVP